MLNQEIEDAQRDVRTDALQMSIGEIVNMYEDDEIIIAPEFQRLFRWEIGQKSNLIESLLLGIPLPSIFVYELPNGKWELVDGLQRISTILEFMGKLKLENGELLPPSILETTKYLPSLKNAVWEKSANISSTDQIEIERSHQLAIKRSRIGVQILKRPSDSKAKYDLFQRLNAGGTAANEQEIRNCIMLMVNPSYYRAVKNAAESKDFRIITDSSEAQIDKQRHIELAVRLLVHTHCDFDGRLDIGAHVDAQIVQLSEEGDINQAVKTIGETAKILNKVAGKNALRRFSGSNYSGRVGLVGLETIAVGVAKNLEEITRLPDPANFVKNKSKDLWSQTEVESFLSPGMRGTTRIQKTIPFGARWFKP